MTEPEAIAHVTIEYMRAAYTSEGEHCLDDVIGYVERVADSLFHSTKGEKHQAVALMLDKLVKDGASYRLP